MKYVLDRIEEDLAILENINTKEKIEISIDELPPKLHEGEIFIYKDNVFLIDKSLEAERRQMLKDKLEKLKKLKEVKKHE